eukprot:3436411-Ditylum_brightwellii.AAC.1
MSAMSFLFPGILRGVREDAPEAWMCKPSTHKSLVATMDFDVQIFAAQFTAEIVDPTPAEFIPEPYLPVP